MLQEKLNFVRKIDSYGYKKEFDREEGSNQEQDLKG